MMKNWSKWIIKKERSGSTRSINRSSTHAKREKKEEENLEGEKREKAAYLKKASSFPHIKSVKFFGRPAKREKKI